MKDQSDVATVLRRLDARVRFRLAMIPSLLLCAFFIGACGSSSSGTDETEPTFDQALAIAKDQLAGQACEFQVEDDSDDALEQKTLDCLTTVGGEKKLYTIFQYTRDLEVSAYEFGGITTAERYFENGNITVDPSGGDPTAIQLDAEAFASAIKEECDCGEVVTPDAVPSS